MAVGSDEIPKPIPFDMIRASLFSGGSKWTSIASKYVLDPGLTPLEAEAAILKRLAQTPSDHNGPRPADAGAVFEAVVRAIASNMRSWSRIDKSLPDIRDRLWNFDPHKVARSGSTERQKLELDLQQLLPGQSQRRDSAAILAWADRLHVEPDFATKLAVLRQGLLDRAAASASVCLNGATRRALPVALTALALGNAPSGIKWPGSGTLKASGMGAALAAEFLRNLGWSGFKPDRHVMRLLPLWCGESPAIRHSANRVLESVFNTRRKDSQDFIYFSLLGAERSPADMALSHADNLVWLFGAYGTTRPKAACD